mmetsp:Transcript_38523/g.73794  ORF Transcript_38523/g.73794 Transcript_38523/m.73794 type:complete len:94 (-) Transcript_38523:91-372(-)
MQIQKEQGRFYSVCFSSPADACKRPPGSDFGLPFQALDFIARDQVPRPSTKRSMPSSTMPSGNTVAEARVPNDFYSSYEEEGFPSNTTDNAPQ